MKRIKNVIYIHTHDMGRYISPYGHAVPTPHLQKFAEQSTLFRQAYCCGPTCSPSRAGLLTGVTPHESGMLGLAHRGFKLSHPEYHLGSYLKTQGYLTALCGMQHEFNSAWEQMPYEHVVKDNVQEGHLATDRAWTDAAASFLNETHERPFFLSYGLFYPHRNFLSADYTIDRPEYIKVPDPLPDTPETRQDMADYHCTIRKADECLGRVLETICKTGRDKDSLIIVTTDHGVAFPKMKCNLTDHGMGVTLMMAYPGNPATGAAVDGLVSHIDVFPTICDLLGIEPPPQLEGHSMRPLFEDKNASIRDAVFSEVSFHAAYEPMRCVRTDRYKLIRRYGFNQRPLANCDDSLSKEVMMDRGWAKLILTETELYDLALDPNEACNIADSQDHLTIRQELEARLDRWMHETNDVLLAGFIERPTGARINSPESTSPTNGPFEPVL
jgi:arylsulfatase A-like enzyme